MPVFSDSRERNNGVLGGGITFALLWPGRAYLQRGESNE
jgi:hypothetical protein